jgi:rSAM/selenodomain-associated transferase 2
MTLPISAIIPTKDEAATVAALVGSLFAQGVSEVIVADASASSDTIHAARSAGATCLEGLAPGRGAQMQAGAQIAVHEVLFFVHADSILQPDAILAIVTALKDRRVVAGSFRLAFDRQHPLLGFLAWCSRFNVAMTTYGDQGLFVRRADFVRCGGYSLMPLLEDYEIQNRLRRAGKFVKLPLNLTTSARRFVKRGVTRQQLLNVAIVIAYRLGVSPHRLAAWYRGSDPS